MNANELADALKNMESGWFDDLTLKEAATMLRQQQVEIEALKAKTLTDEEIIELFANHKFSEEGVAKFARAILKKASEK